MNQIDKHYFIDIVAIQKTIKDYTTDNFINTYAESLLTQAKTDDKELTLYLLKKLISWYDREIIKIEADEYIYNKEAHRKSYFLLKEMFCKLRDEDLLN